MGLYYLQSRYYDASIGRFLNADAYFLTGQDIDSYNMFAYCGNNPIVRTDASMWAKQLGSPNTINIRVPNYALNDPSVTYFPTLDRIGPAYYFSNLNYLNNIRMK